MRGTKWGRLALAATVAAVLALVVRPGPAAAEIDTQPSQSGSLTMTSDPGDYLGQGPVVCLLNRARRPVLCRGTVRRHLPGGVGLYRRWELLDAGLFLGV
jgi:hypothetical protein